MKGWFDAFREEGGPTLYAYHNRTAVAADVPALALVVAALTLYIAFLAIFPGIRKEVIRGHLNWINTWLADEHTGRSP